MENPIINPNYFRRRHRYVYGIGVSKDFTNRGQVRTWFDNKCYLSVLSRSFVFVRCEIVIQMRLLHFSGVMRNLKL